MNFTDEEIKLVEAHRAKAAKAAKVVAKELAAADEAKKLANVLEARHLAAAEAAQEQARRQQSINKTVADLIEQAKTLLIDAKQIAKDNGMEWKIGDMVTNMVSEVSDGQYWYGSDQSLC